VDPDVVTIPDAADRDELASVHRRVVEAVGRCESRFAGRRCRRQLVDARLVEQVLLARLGFESYGAYLMAHARPAGPGPVSRRRPRPLP